MNAPLLEGYCAAISPLTRGGFHPYALVTHAWHESGAFDQPVGHYNLWGIKVPRRWRNIKDPNWKPPYPVIEILTHEYASQGSKYYTREPFIDFPTLHDAVQYYAHLVFRLYRDAAAQRTAPTAFFSGLIRGPFRWATDPGYVSKLGNLCISLSDNPGVNSLLRPRMAEFGPAAAALAARAQGA